MKQNDRVSYSFGMKLSLPTKYESADFHISLTSDVNEGETTAQAFQRVKSEVEAKAKQYHEQIKGSENGLETKEEQPAQPLPKASSPSPKSTKVSRQTIKTAFAVLKDQKKVTAESFKKDFLFNQKVDELSDEQVTATLLLLSTAHPQLGIN